MTIDERAATDDVIFKLQGVRDSMIDHNDLANCRRVDRILDLLHSLLNVNYERIREMNKV
ncbi:hypothetical protein [Pseudobutyrivibrio sp.]